MVLYDALIRMFNNDCFTEFYKLLHELIKLNGLDIVKQTELIKHLSKYITEDNEDDDGCDRYLSRRDIAYCAINLVLVEMKQKFAYGHYEIEGEYIIEKDSFDDTLSCEDFINNYLNNKEQFVIRQTLEGKTQKEIGKHLGVTQTQVHTIIVSIRSKYRKYLDLINVTIN